MRLDAGQRQGQGLASRQERSVGVLIKGPVQPSTLGTNLGRSKSDRLHDRTPRPPNYLAFGLRNRPSADTWPSHLPIAS